MRVAQDHGDHKCVAHAMAWLYCCCSAKDGCANPVSMAALLTSASQSVGPVRRRASESRQSGRVRLSCRLAGCLCAEVACVFAFALARVSGYRWRWVAPAAWLRLSAAGTAARLPLLRRLWPVPATDGTTRQLPSHTRQRLLSH
jgi:hypothetical protein